MFWHLFWKEIREHLTTFRFASASVTILLLSIASVWVLTDDFERRRDTCNRLAGETALAARDYKVPSHIIPSAYYPPAPLSIFIQGKSKSLGNVVEINRWEVPRDASESLTDNMLLAALPPFDLLAIYTTVISLFGILFTYDAITAERSRGTLKLLCSNGSGRASIYLAKFFAGITILLIPIALSMLGTLIVLQFTFSVSLTQLQWLGVLVILLSGLVYGTIFIALGLLCSSLLKHSQTSLALSLLVWVFVVVLIPKLATSVSPSLYSLPSPAEIDALEKNTRGKAITDGEQFSQEIQSLNNLDQVGFWGTVGSNSYSCTIRWGTKDAFILVEELVRFSDPMWQKRAEQIWALVSEHEKELENQAEFTNSFNMISPAHLLRIICTSIARTDYRTYDDFMKRSRDYRRAFLESLHSKGYFSDNSIAFVTQLPWNRNLTREEHRKAVIDHITRVGGGDEVRWEDRISEDNWPALPADIIPVFSFEDLEPRFEETFFPFTVMILTSLIIFFVGFVAFNRYDVR